MSTVEHAIPLGDRRKFIIKDGVIQPGFTPVLYGVTTEYDSANKMLAVLKQDTTRWGNISFLVDITSYNYVFGNLFPYTLSSSYFYDNIQKINVSNSNTSNVTDINVGIGGKYDLRSLTGSLYIQVGGYSFNYINEYSVRIKDLWLE